MVQKKSLQIIFFLFMCYIVDAQDIKTISANMGNVSCSFELDNDGAPHYSVFFKNKPVIRSSALGFVLDPNIIFDNNFDLLAKDEKMVDEIKNREANSRV